MAYSANEKSMNHVTTQKEALISAAIRRKEKRKRAKERAFAAGLVGLSTAGALGAVMLALKDLGGTPSDVLALFVMYLLTMIGVELGYHRYFTHRACKTRSWLERVLAVLGSMSLQGPLVWWAGVHRVHHANTDSAKDPHSPQYVSAGTARKFLHSHIGWLFKSECVNPNGGLYNVSDLYNNPVALRATAYYWRWGVAGLILPGIFCGLATQSFEAFLTGILWGGFLRVFLCHHFFWSLNSFCHLVGSRAYKAKNNSTNNLLVALVTLGQGWHNNHHAFPSSAKVGLKFWHIDLGWMILKFLSLFGVV